MSNESTMMGIALILIFGGMLLLPFGVNNLHFAQAGVIIIAFAVFGLPIIFVECEKG